MAQDFPAPPTTQVLLPGLVIDLAREELRTAQGDQIELRPRSFAVLRLLSTNPDRLVTRQEIMECVWRGIVVTDDSLTQCIADIRRALGDAERKIIKTIPGRGFQFTGLAAGQSAGTSMPLRSTPPLPDKPSIAVLPFANMSGDPAQDYFADGIVEDITTALTRFPSLFVIARNSSFAYKGRSVDIRQVGQELGVRYVLEGSVRKSENRLRITAQLVQADSGIHVWAERHDGDVTEIFALQDEITTSVVGALVPSLQRAEVERARRTPPANLDAYDLYLHALAHRGTLTREGIDEALRLIDRALALDPMFVSAALLASLCWTLRFAQGWAAPAQAHAESVRYARLAVSLDAHNADALAILARRIAQAERDYEEALSLAERAMATNPNSAEVWRYSGFVFLYVGDGERAFDCFRRALRLSPHDAGAYDTWSGSSLALIQLEQDQQAVTAARQAVQLNPLYTTAWRAYTAALALSGRVDESQSAARRLLELDPGCSISEVWARYGHTERSSARYFEGLRKAGLPE